MKHIIWKDLSLYSFLVLQVWTMLHGIPHQMEPHKLLVYLHYGSDKRGIFMRGNINDQTVVLLSHSDEVSSSLAARQFTLPSHRF